MDYQALFTNDQINQLFKNDKAWWGLEEEVFYANFKPVALLHAEKLNYKFLVTQLDHRNPNVAFVFSSREKWELCFEALQLTELANKISKRGDVLKSDPSFVGEYNLAIYAKVADNIGEIVTDSNLEGSKELFEKFNKIERYKNSNQNMNRFRFEFNI